MVDSIFFSHLNCPISEQILPAILLVNNSLPCGEKISIVDEHSGDPRLEMIRGKVRCPVLITTRSGVVKELGRFKEGRVERAMIVSGADLKYYLNLLLQLKYR